MRKFGSRTCDAVAAISSGVSGNGCLACTVINASFMPLGSVWWRAAACMMRRAQSASRTARRACGLTCVVSTAATFSSAQMPNSTALMPLVSASVSSVTLPTPIMIATSG